MSRKSKNPFFLILFIVASSSAICLIILIVSLNSGEPVVIKHHPIPEICDLDEYELLFTNGVIKYPPVLVGGSIRNYIYLEDKPDRIKIYLSDKMIDIKVVNRHREKGEIKGEFIPSETYVVLDNGERRREGDTITIKGQLYKDRIPYKDTTKIECSLRVKEIK